MQRAVNAYLKPIEALTTNTNGAAQATTYGQLAAGMFFADLGVQYVPGALKIPWRPCKRWPGKRAVSA
jgi:hypothetical protein